MRKRNCARLDIAEIVRAEIKWRKLKGREVGVPLSDLVDRYLEGLKKRTEPERVLRCRPGAFPQEKQWLDGYDYEVYIRMLIFRAFNIALSPILYAARCAAAVLAQRDEDQIDVVERIFRSRCAGRPTAKSICGACADCAFLCLSRICSGRARVKSGHIQLRENGAQRMSRPSTQHGSAVAQRQ